MIAILILSYLAVIFSVLTAVYCLDVYLFFDVYIYLYPDSANRECYYIVLVNKPVIKSDIDFELINLSLGFFRFSLTESISRTRIRFIQTGFFDDSLIPIL